MSRLKYISPLPLFGFGSHRNQIKGRTLSKLTVIMLTFLFILGPISPAFGQVAEEQVVVEEQGIVASVEEFEIKKNTEDQVASADSVSGEQETTKGGAPQESNPTMSMTGDEGNINSNPNEPLRKGVVLPEADSRTGALTYSIPLEIAPGRNGLQPNLTISYNSQNRDRGSYVGLGWNINIVSIERTNKYGLNHTYARNDFTSSLTGELVDFGNGNFGSKVESGEFLSYAFSNNTWIVKDKKGTTYKFGTTAQARQDDPSDPNKVYKWMLEEVRDTNDNFIRYEYFKDQGQVYPSKIFYTGSGSSDGIFTLDFLRTQRNTPYLSYSTGFAVKTIHHITEVTSSINEQWNRKYVLSYTVGSNTGDDLLSSVTESGRADDGSVYTLPSVNFTYQTDDPNTNNFWYGGYISPIDVQSRDAWGGMFTDINGDGLTDILKSYKNYSGPGVDEWIKKAYIANGQGQWIEAPEWEPPFVFYQNFQSGPGVDYGARSLDVNGDGLMDLVKGYYIDQVAYLNTGNGWQLAGIEWNPVLPLIGCPYSSCGPFHTVELNGEGLVDFIRTTTVWNGSEYVPHTERQVSTGPDWSHSDPYISPIDVQSNYAWGGMFTDINGDGLTDILKSLLEYDSPSGNVWIKKAYIANGQGQWIEAPEWEPPFVFYYQPQSGNGTDYGARSLDVNGDGLMDLLRAQGDVYNDKTYLNTGNGWVQTTEWHPGVPLIGGQYNTWEPNHVVELNGDGINDYIRTKTVWNGSEYVPETEAHWSNEKRLDLLVNITYSTGGQTDITYKTTPLYRGGTTFLNPDLPNVMVVVDEISNDDGFINISNTNFTYEQGLNYYGDPHDRKFAGFGKIIKTDSVGNKTITYYHQGNETNSALGEYDDHGSKIGYPYRVEQQDASGNLYNVSVTKWDRQDLGNNRSFVKKVRATNLTYNGNATHRDVAATFTYNNTNGNLLTREQWGEVSANPDGSFTDIGNDKLSTTNTYATGGSYSVTGLPATQVTLDQSANKVNETRHYYDNLALGSVNKGNETKTDQMVVPETYIDIEKTYNSYGLITQELDARDKPTTYIYDSFNLYPTTVTNALNQSTQYLYDYSLGKPKQITDANGAIAQTIYDGLDRVIEQKQSDRQTPANLVTSATYTYTYLPVGLQTQETKYLDAATTVDAYSYTDGLGRQIQTRVEAETPGQFTVSDVVYNNRGLKQKESLPYFSSGSAKTTPTAVSNLYTNYTYDALGRVISTTNVVGTVATAYDDWKVTITDARNNPINRYQDAYGRLVKVEEINNSNTYTTLYEHSSLGLLTKITDAAGNVRNFTYDALGRRLTAEDLHAPADSTFGTWAYTYDVAGNLLTKLDPKSQIITYNYDDINRVLTEDFDGLTGVEVTYVYDTCINGIGRLCSVTNSALAQNLLYDALGSVEVEIKTIDSTPYQSNYTYDRLGNQLIVTNPDGSQVKNIYNSAGQLEQVQRKETADPSFINVVNNFDYGPHGQVTVQQNANSTTTTNTYDSAELYRLRTKVTSNGTANLQNLTYTYDANGNITQLVDASVTNSAKTVNYTYDNLNRLLTAITTGAANGQNYTHTYTYDAIGNILTGPAGAYTYSSAGYANPHAVTSINGVSYNYDNNGNLISVGGTTYTWDYNNRLVQTDIIGPPPSPETVGLFPSIGDGSVAYYHSNPWDILSNWDTTHDAPVGQEMSYTNSVFNVRTGKTSTTEYRIERAFLPFDTSSLPDNATITAAKLKVYVAKLKTNGDDDGDDWVTVVQGFEPSEQVLTLDDYDQAGTINNPTEGIDVSERKDITVVPRLQFTEFNLNSLGRSWVNNNGVTKFALREGHDVLDSPYMGSSNSYNSLQIRSSEYPGTDYDPVLEITYTVPPVAETINYAYDSAGQRVKIINGGITTVYPTMFYNTDGTNIQKHIMAGGVVATVSGTGVSAVPYFVATDHLTGSNVVTNNTGVLEELMDYYPFGSVRLDEQAGEFNEQRKFAGHEYDADTGLTYMNARYYDGAIGRFISQDPLEIVGFQTTDAKRFVQIISSPQNWNTYSYALNNPLIAIDPSGLLTVYVPGTNYDSEEINNSDLQARLINAFNDNNVRYLEWNNGPNDSGERTKAANVLANAINSWKFADGEKLNIVAHSHGGNVVMEATHLLNRSINQLVTLGTPSLSQYQPAAGSINYHLNISSLNDSVQRNAGTSETIYEKSTRLPFGNTMNSLIGIGLTHYLGGGETGYAGKVFAGANNKLVERYVSNYETNPIRAHTQLWKNEGVWNNVVLRFIK